MHTCSKSITLFPFLPLPLAFASCPRGSKCQFHTFPPPPLHQDVCKWLNCKQWELCRKTDQEDNSQTDFLFLAGGGRPIPPCCRQVSSFRIKWLAWLWPGRSRKQRQQPPSVPHSSAPHLWQSQCFGIQEEDNPAPSQPLGSTKDSQP